jgi:hypothetical protein
MELIKTIGIKKYYIDESIRKRSAGYCKLCCVGFVKNDTIKTLFCDSGIDDLDEIEPHCVGIFHENCFELFEY